MSLGGQGWPWTGWGELEPTHRSVSDYTAKIEVCRPDSESPTSSLGGLDYCLAGWQNWGGLDYSLTVAGETGAKYRPFQDQLGAGYRQVCVLSGPCVSRTVAGMVRSSLVGDLSESTVWLNLVGLPPEARGPQLRGARTGSWAFSRLQLGPSSVCLLPNAQESASPPGFLGKWCWRQDGDKWVVAESSGIQSCLQVCHQDRGWWVSRLAASFRMFLRGLSLHQGFTVSYLDYRAPTEMLLFIRACSVTQSCLTLCGPIDYSPTGSSVCGIFQARILEWVCISFSRESSGPGDHIHVSYISCIGRWVLPWAPPGKLPLSMDGCQIIVAQRWYKRGHLIWPPCFHHSP